MKIGNDLWSFWTQFLAMVTDGSPKRVVGRPRGQEFRAVLIDAPDPQTISDRREFTPSKSRRVFYIGVSRAERLLAIRVLKSRISSLANRLGSEGIAITAETV